ncbi:MAG: PD-(D/E)XK nuclease family protein, partial [Thermoleophilaceae bacterium]|nr:PD-(D/E)XK nuclease family protein [Thermoleophilaceae bacterium]
MAELERSMVEPARLTQALRAWAGDGPRRAYAEEVADLYRRYRAGLEAAGLMDEDLFAWRALDALRRDPASWGVTPVFVYGFDDFTPVELDALEVLARVAGAEVTVSLPYEPGREAFRATARIREELSVLADRVEHLEPSDDHYAKGSRDALHALERGLFQPGASEGEPGSAVRLHAAGGERAEAELCGAEVLRLLRGGTAPGEIAVVLRDPAAYASTVEQVFGAYGIPYSIDRSVPLAHTSLGRGLLALLRCACLDGGVADLLAYLRTPGLLTEPGLADRLEADVRREGVATAAGARAVWEEQVPTFGLDVIDRLADATGVPELLDVLGRCLDRLFGAPYRRSAPVLEGAELDDARAFRAAGEAIRELRAVLSADPRVRLDRRRVHDTLSTLPVRVGESSQPDRVQVASPQAVRARRFEAVLVCGLQEGEFPRGSVSEVFLPDADRRAIATASGLRLPMREERLERERYLFYVCASRAERELVLSSRFCDEEGNPQARSFFVDDVLAIFPSLKGGERRRSLAEVTWEPAEAPTPAEWERSVALRGPRRLPAPVASVTAPAARELLERRDTVSAGALEKYAGCPVRWLVEEVLRPARIEPDSDSMVRGSLAHRVLELTFRRLRERTGQRAISPGNLGQAEEIMREAMEEERDRYRVAATDSRVQAAVRRLEHDLLVALRHESEQGAVFEPGHLELRFGLEEGGYPAVEVADGVRVRGMIDRVDVWGRYALVRDYKSGRVESYKEASWVRERRLQAPLYMLVVEELLGLE